MPDGVADLAHVLRSTGRAMPVVVPPDLGSVGRTHVFVVDDIVVKCEQRVGTSSMLRERSALALLDGCDLPVPRLVDRGTFDDTREWVVLERLPGHPPPDAANPAHELSPELAAQLGEIAGRLHGGPRPPKFGTWALERNRTLLEEQRAWLEIIVRMAHDADIVPRAETDALASVLRRSVESLESCRAPLLVHRDIQPRNVLVEGDDARVTALLDFESSAGGDPADDFKVVGLDWTTPAFAAFAGSYEATGRSLGPDAGERVTHHVLSWALVVFAYLGRIAPAYLEPARRAVVRALDGDRPPLPDGLSLPLS